MEFKYLIIAICFILLAFLIYKEVTRQDKGWMIARITASVFAVFALTFLILPFNYSANRTTRVNELILLTPGTGKDSISKLSNTVLYTTDSAILKENNSVDVTFIPDLSYYLAANPDVNTIRIYGYGLSEDELTKLKSYQLKFHFPAQHPSGIVACNWNSVLKSTEPLVVQGTYNNTSANAVKLVLKGLGSGADSVTIKPNKSSHFSFKTTPAQLGKAIYEIVSLQGRDTLKVEKVPFEVVKSNQMNVLVLASSPDFEYKFLKNWLYENKYPLSIRTTISKNKYSSDFLNMESNNLTRIDRSLLQKFDLIIADEIELSALSAAEKSAINASAEQGLGVILRVNTEKSSTSFSRMFAFYPSGNQNDKIFTPQLDRSPLKPLAYEQGIFIKSQNGEQPMVSDQKSRILVSSKVYGKGKIIASAIPSTYSWLLSGNQKEYAAFWSELISRTAKQEFKSENLTISPAFPVALQSTNITLESGNLANTPVLTVHDVDFHSEQNSELPFLSKYSLWFEKSDWNTINYGSNISNYMYSYAISDWTDLKRENTFVLNELQSKNIEFNSNNAVDFSDYYGKTISKLVFLFIFLTSISFLWFELRFLSNK